MNATLIVTRTYLQHEHHNVACVVFWINWNSLYMTVNYTVHEHYLTCFRFHNNVYLVFFNLRDLGGFLEPAKG